MRLVIDDVYFEKILPTTVRPDRGPSGDTIFYSSYKLERNAQNNATWQQLLRQFKFTRPVDLTLGLKLTNGTWVYLPTTIEANRGDAESLKIQLVSPWSFGGALSVIAVALIFSRPSLFRQICCVIQVRRCVPRNRVHCVILSASLDPKWHFGFFWWRPHTYLFGLRQTVLMA